LLALTVMPRSAGFTVTDTTALSEGSLLSSTLLMFIGGGPAATAGGIKTTGFAVLVIALLAAVRGRETAHAGRFGVSARLVNHAVAVACVLAGTVLLVALVLSGDRTAGQALFDATSGVTTTGLLAGPPLAGTAAKLALTLGMLVGRLAPMLLAVRLLEHRKALVRPAEREIVIT
jgi:Trk-type K+ transport system membrane component